MKLFRVYLCEVSIAVSLLFNILRKKLTLDTCHCKSSFSNARRCSLGKCILLMQVGWGYASENPELPILLSKLSPPVIFIGPNSASMRALGDKIAATIVAQSAQVSCIDWSGSGVILPIPTSGILTVPPEIYEQACVQSLNDGIKHAERIGYPVMIKASEGGGGKGIRIVHEKSAFDSMFAQVQYEVPNSAIFVMKVIGDARHLEVQILADKYGSAIALFGRDCSVQRRHQKIIEEAPVTIAPSHILREMEAAAVRLAKLVGYTSAG